MIDYEKQKSHIRWWMIAAAILISTWLMLPAQAHSLTDLDDWYLDWRARTEQGLTIELIAEVSDMMDRHPDYIPPAFRESHEVAAVQPKPTPKPDRKPSAGAEAWRGLITSIWPAELVDRAVCVVGWESKGDPSAYNPSSASGLFQVKQFWFDSFGGSAFDPENNTRVAYLVYQAQGWGAWAAVNRGQC